MTDINFLFQSSTSLEPTTVRKGKDFCPQVGYPTPEHSVKFFHVGAVQTSFELAFRNIPQVRVRLFLCFLHIRTERKNVYWKPPFLYPVKLAFCDVIRKSSHRVNRQKGPFLIRLRRYLFVFAF